MRGHANLMPVSPDPFSPIGVFDSGLGGLSVVRQLRTELPRESILYIADSRYCPYGVRDEAEIRERTCLLVSRLVQLGAKLIVVACNTASAASIEMLRESMEVPIVAMEPAVKPAMTLTVTGKVAILATPRTAASARLRRLIDRYGGGIDVRAIGIPGLADCVETGDMAGPEVERLLEPIVPQLIADGVDVLVLGCTHYPFVEAVIRKLAGPAIRIVDSGNAVARRTRELLIKEELLASIGARPTFTMWTTGSPAAVGPIATGMLGETVVAQGLGSVAITGLPVVHGIVEEGSQVVG
jgi:glutamate racemase